MWEAIKDFLNGLVENLPVLLVVAGIVLFVIGAAGGVTYGGWLPVPDLTGRLLLVGGGVLLLVLGLVLRSAAGGEVGIEAAKYGVTITHPTVGEALERKVAIRGTCKSAPPEGYELRLLRIYPQSENYYPMGKAVINGSGKTWDAEQCDLGGNAAEKRIIGVYLVGPSGRKFLDYFKRAELKHGETLRQLDKAGVKDGDFLPLLSEKTSDMLECHRILVVRK